MSKASEAGTLHENALAFVSDGHRTAVLAHPCWHDISQEPNLAFQLVWMVRQGLLSYDELDDLQTLEEETSERDRIIEEAFMALGRGNSLANCMLLDQLLADSLITPMQHRTAMDRPLQEPCKRRYLRLARRNPRRIGIQYPQA